MKDSMQDSKVLITGGTGSLGRALIAEFASAGYSVAFQYYRNETQAEELVREHGASQMRLDMARSFELPDAQFDVVINNAGVNISDVDYISSHGNSMPDYDVAETNAFKLALRDHAYSIPISSIKSMVGQPIAASGILQAIATSLSVREGIIPGTLNLTTPDPRCDLDYVPGTARAARIRHALANAHSVGGTHSVLVLKHVE